MNNPSITVELFFGSDGRIDESATLAACEAAVSLQVAELETQGGQISEAVHAVFDEAAPGTRLTYDTIATLAVQRLGGKADNTAYLKSRVLGWVRNNADSAKTPRPGSLFVVKLGVGGGVARRSDMPAPTAQG